MDGGSSERNNQRDSLVMVVATDATWIVVVVDATINVIPWQWTDTDVMVAWQWNNQRDGSFAMDGDSGCNN
jgi:Co/Zn/Cd efflux system component